MTSVIIPSSNNCGYSMCCSIVWNSNSAHFPGKCFSLCQQRRRFDAHGEKRRAQADSYGGTRWAARSLTPTDCAPSGEAPNSAPTRASLRRHGNNHHKTVAAALAVVSSTHTEIMQDILQQKPFGRNRPLPVPPN
jgi:hypothetical protein